jgi:ribosomal-protein-alanine N-acetyltransferase
MLKLFDPDLCTIRLMTQDDVAQVAKIESQSYPFPWPQSIFEDSLKAGFTGQVFVYQDEIVGYIFTQHAAQECHLLNLCVSPQYRGLGIAAQLLTAALEMTRLKEGLRVYLEVRESNQIAVNLYEKFGFIVVGRRRDYYPAENGKEDALLLTLDLSEPRT